MNPEQILEKVVSRAFDDFDIPFIYEIKAEWTNYLRYECFPWLKEIK